MKVCTRSRLFASPSPLRRLKCDMSPLFLDRSDTSTGADRKRDYCRKSDLPYSCSCQRGRASADLRHSASSAFIYLRRRCPGEDLHATPRVDCVIDCTHNSEATRPPPGPPQPHTHTHTRSYRKLLWCGRSDHNKC